MRATRYGHVLAQANGAPADDYASKPGDDLSRLPNLTLSRGTAYAWLQPKAAVQRENGRQPAWCGFGLGRV